MKNKHFFFIILIPLLWWSAQESVLAADPSVIIGEVQTSGGKADDEFIRLENKTTTLIDLSGFKLTKKSLSNGSCKESTLVSAKHFRGNVTPHGSFLIAHPDYRDLYAADLDYSGASYYIADTAVILLYDKEGLLLDRKTIGTACDTIPSPVDPPIPSPSPDPPSPPEITEPISVRINEIFPNPKEKDDAGEFIELHNFGTSPADISGWTLRDATKTGMYVFPTDTVIGGGDYLAVTDRSFTFSLNNTGETLSLSDTNDALVHTIRYEKTKENVSLNYAPTGFRGGKPTPGKENILNTLPETKEKVPKNGFRDMPIDFNARGKDADGDTLKYVWDFGDGHKSYRKKTSHTYEKNGDYTVRLTTTDGSDDLAEIFTLNIRSYETPDIRITALAPNPKGKDADNEWLVIENRGKKAVNLKGFGIATGQKSLVNHPIRENLVIKARSAAKITRALSLFTLPNRKGKVELRAPNGETLQKIKYVSEASVAEDAVYRKEKGKRWEWKKGEMKTPPPSSEPEATEENDTTEKDTGTETVPTEDVVPERSSEQEEKRVTPPTAGHVLGEATEIPSSKSVDSRVQDPPVPITDDVSSETSLWDYAVSLFEGLFSDFNASLNAALSGTVGEETGTLSSF